MRNKIEKTFFNTLLLCAFFAQTNLTMAASLNGALGNASSATDYYRITCGTNSFGDTYKLNVALADVAPVAAPIISIQVIKGALGKNTYDTNDGDTVYSSAAIVQGGNGIYQVIIDKTSAGVENYTLKYNCQNSAGATTDTSIVTVQNQ
ncbi:hypothetical protein [Methylovulum psychrotolerans]|uniref:Spore coat protein U domain-containing protein n=1 Tax=Methylovulum psychrotolerans TaxID=1704499 RepID=A0A1Z4BY06_9GAMM|nr:hypothetical protein [Methylovulum psychrotolerans]ASF46176.1 hypothetical protein CEK71_08825 [Methylovulum psychrotolerans]